MESGGDYLWTVCNPFAILYIFCESAKKIADLLCRSLESNGNGLHGSIVLYTDETTHGNVKRHDLENELQGVYWTIPQLPSWFRKRATGWLYFGCLKTVTQKGLRGGLSGLATQIIRRFYSPNGFNFAVGARLPKPDGGLMCVRLRLEGFLQDEKAHKGVTSVKGSGGWKCCLKCDNILNIDPELLEGQQYYLHYACAVPAQFVLHTPESFFAKVDQLKEAHGRISPTAFDTLQKNFGITWCPDGPLMDPHCRLHYNPVDGTVFDPMHCFVASSGLSQYEVNGFCLACVEEGYSLEFIDLFQQRITWPKASHSLPKVFFRNRVVKKPENHIKAFAGECLAAVTALCMFYITVLRPAGKLSLHGKCILLPQDMHEILFALGDNAKTLGKVLESLMVVHHSLFTRL